MGLFFQLLCATLFQALIINIIFRIAAKHEADTDFSKSAMVAAIIVTVGWIMGQMLMDRVAPLIGLPLIAVVMAVLTVFVFGKLCWLSVRTAILTATIFMVLNGAILIGLGLVYHRTMYPSLPGKVKAATEEAAKKTPRKVLPPEVQKLADLEAWRAARMPLHKQIGGLLTALRIANPPLKVSSLSANLKTQWSIDGPSRHLEMEINGETKGPGGEERVATLIHTLKDQRPFKGSIETAKLKSIRTAMQAGDTQKTLFFQIVCRYKRTPVSDFAGELTPAEATDRIQTEMKKYCPPSVSPRSWAADQVAQASAAAGVEASRAHPAKVSVLSNAAFLPYRVDFSSRDSIEKVVRLIEELEVNPYCTVTFVKFVAEEVGGQPYTTLFCEWPVVP